MVENKRPLGYIECDSPVIESTNCIIPYLQRKNKFYGNQSTINWLLFFNLDSKLYEAWLDIIRYEKTKPKKPN